MNTSTAIPANHRELISEASFLRKEIEFLLKMLRNGYSVSINIDKIKQLDAYWKGFEKNRNLLDDLLNKIRKDEINLSRLYQNSLIDEEKTPFNDEGLAGLYQIIEKDVRALKESFYDSALGCEGCCYKNK